MHLAGHGADGGGFVTHTFHMNWLGLWVSLPAWPTMMAALGVAIVLGGVSRVTGIARGWLCSLAWLVGLAAIVGLDPQVGQDWWLRAAVVFSGWTLLALFSVELFGPGFGTALAVALASCGIGTFIGHMGWLGERDLRFVAHLGAVLCVSWIGVAAMLCGTARRGPVQGLYPTLEVLKIAALTGGLTVVVAHGFAMVMLLSLRVFRPYEWAGRRTLSDGGLIDLLAVLAAIGLWRLCGRSLLQLFCAFGVTFLAVIYSGLMIPPDLAITASRSPGWMPWTLWIQTGLAAQVAGFVIVTGLIARVRRRRLFWPGRLTELLNEQLPRREALRQAMGLVGMVVVLLGVFHIFKMPVYDRWTALVTCVCGLSVSIATFMMAHRRWDGNLALVGAATMTLAGAVFPVILYPVDTAGDATRQAPVLLNTLAFGLVAMVALWHWLATVWQQQLHDGRPWTTTGRLIPLVLRMGFMTGALATMLLFLMATWPERGLHIMTRDDSAGRWIAGLAACVLLVLVLGFSARSTGKVTLVWLMGLTLFVMAVFIAVRLPYGDLREWLVRNGPVICLGLVPPLWLMSRLVAGRR